MSKLIWGVSAAIVSTFTGCKEGADTYQWAENRGLFSQVRWSFTQPPAADVYLKDAKFKSYFKTPVLSYDFTVYNNGRVSADQMQADFTGGTLWLNGVSLTSGSPFAVNGENKLTFSFKPAGSRPKGKFPISIYSFIEGREKQLTTYNLELFDNMPPQASFMATKKSSLNYDLDAGLSVDGDADFGGKLKSFVWKITDLADTTRTQGFPPATQRVLSYPFPYAGNFKVKLTVADTDDSTAVSEQIVAVN